MGVLTELPESQHGPNQVVLTNGLISGCQALMGISGRTTLPYIMRQMFQFIPKWIWGL